jgi:hypothetical protein
VPPFQRPFAEAEVGFVVMVGAAVGESDARFAVRRPAGLDLLAQVVVRFTTCVWRFSSVQLCVFTSVGGSL